MDRFSSSTPSAWIAGIFQPVVSLLILAACVGAFLTLGHRSASSGHATVAPVAVAVEVVPVSDDVSGIDFEVHGIVVPFQEIQVSAEVVGQVSYRSDDCRIGRTVTRGQTLMRIDPKDYELEVRRLEEQWNQAQATLHEGEVDISARGRQIELAREELAIEQRELQRYEATLHRPGVYSDSELDDVRLRELQSRTTLQTVIDQLEVLQARQRSLVSACELAARQLDKAKLDLARTEIVAPIDGLIIQEPVEQGSYVQRGGVVAILQDTSRVEVRCSLQMRELHWLWQTPHPSQTDASAEHGYRFPKTAVTVVYSLGTAACKWQGVLEYFDGGRIDERTRMVPCRVLVSEPMQATIEPATSSRLVSPALMVGMFVSVHVHATPDVPLLRIPASALQPGGTVWTVVEGRLREVPVQVAHATNDYVLIYGESTGLRSGDRVVVSPLAAPTEGAAVTIRGAP